MPLDETPDVPSLSALPGAVMSARTTRRNLLKGAAATGVGAATAGVIADLLLAGPASAAELPAASDDGTGDLVAHVRDAKRGHIDVYVGTRHVSVTDRALAAKLARAAR